MHIHGRQAQIKSYQVTKGRVTQTQKLLRPQSLQGLVLRDAHRSCGQLLSTASCFRQYFSLVSFSFLVLNNNLFRFSSSHLLPCCLLTLLFIIPLCRWSTETGGFSRGAPELHDMLGEYIWTEAPTPVSILSKDLMSSTCG